jgi:hypothetical protein
MGTTAVYCRNYRVAHKERMFLEIGSKKNICFFKWVVVERVKVSDLSTPSENSAIL